MNTANFVKAPGVKRCPLTARQTERQQSACGVGVPS